MLEWKTSKCNPGDTGRGLEKNKLEPVKKKNFIQPKITIIKAKSVQTRPRVRLAPGSAGPPASGVWVKRGRGGFLHREEDACTELPVQGLEGPGAEPA